jgi:putative toxin-antitoxin system antitoxin component (TIGR02293 family)
MTDQRSSASASPVATSKHGASAKEKSVATATVRTGRIRVAKAEVVPISTRNAPAQPGGNATNPTAAKSAPAIVALARTKAALPSYLAVYRATALERIDMIRRGIPAAAAKRLFADLPIGQGAGFKALNLSTATVNKKAKHGETLSPGESERIVGFAKLVGQLEAMVQDSGNPTNFDARAWMARWLNEPLPAFGGARPADLIDTMEGQGLVSAALAKIQSGAYA